MLEDELFLALAVTVIFKDDVLRVGKLLVIVEEIFPAERSDGRRMDLDAQTPAGDIEIVDAVIAHVAGTVVPVPVPLVVEAVFVEREEGGGAGPGVVIDAGGDRRVWLAADVLAELDVPGFGGEDTADLAGLDVLDRKSTRLNSSHRL